MSFLARIAPHMPPLTLPELAMLELTNDPQIRVPRARRKIPNVLTTKDSYIWAVILTRIAESEQTFTAQDLTGILVASRGAASDAWGILQRRLGDSKLVDAELTDIVANAYRSLIRKGLIEDPPVLTISGIAILVLGSMPVSFTTKTKDGKLLSKKICAAFWKYEKNHKGGVSTEIIEFKLMRLLKAFQAGFAGFKAALGEDSSTLTEK